MPKNLKYRVLDTSKIIMFKSHEKYTFIKKTRSGLKSDPFTRVRRLIWQYFPSLYEIYLKKTWRDYLNDKYARIYFSKKPGELSIKSIGKRTYSANAINVHHVTKNAEIYIGSYVSIGLDLKLITSGGHSPKNFTTFPFFSDEVFETGNVTIGNDVWIGDNVTIFGGVNISDGAVIGAGSIVTKSVEPYSIYAGVPAKRIKYRFSEEIRNKLMGLPWWNLSDKYIQTISNLLVNGRGLDDLLKIEKIMHDYSQSESNS